MSTVYSSEVFDSLGDHLTAAEKVEEHNDALMRVGSILCKHNLYDQLALVLLHKHFDIKDEERLVETFSDDKAHIRLTTVRDETIVMPYLWKLGRDSLTHARVWQPLEFVYTSALPAEMAEFLSTLASRDAFFEEIENEFIRSDIADIFGLAFLHRSTILSVGPDESLVESTDHRTSTLTWSVMSNAELSPKLTRTYWRFQADGSLDEVRDRCRCP